MKTCVSISTLFALLSFGCGTTASDDPSSGTSSSESGDSSNDSTVTITSTTMTTMDSMSGTDTTMTTEPTTTDPVTTDPTTDTDTDPTTTTDPDTSASATDTDSTSTTDPSDTSGSSTDPGTSTGGDAVDYGPCDFEDPENPACPEGQICILIEMGEFAGYNWCGVPCEGDSKGCPENPDGDAVVECSGLGACALDCEDAECPAGMECNPIGSGDRCAWPGEG